MLASVMTRKGQVTIPKEIRDRLGLRRGTKLLFLLRDEELSVRPVQGTILELKGSVKASHRPEDFVAIRETVKQAVARRARKDG
jgi:AbrB family looped-hinge helix DNA binding protein